MFIFIVTVYIRPIVFGEIQQINKKKISIKLKKKMNFFDVHLLQKWGHFYLTFVLFFNTDVLSGKQI